MLAERDKNNNQKKNRNVLVQHSAILNQHQQCTTVLFAVLCECKYGFKNARSNVVFTFALSDLQSLPGFLRKSHVSFPSLWKKKKKKLLKGEQKEKESKWNRMKRKTKEISRNCFFRISLWHPAPKKDNYGGQRGNGTIFACFMENHS